MKDIYLGTHPLGARFVRVYAIPDSPNGTVLVKPPDKGTPIVRIGIESEDFGEVLSIALHEVYELTLIDLNTRYEHDPTWSNSAAHFLFVMTHEQFSEATDRVGDFFQRILPKLTLEHKALHAKLDKKKRK